MQTCNNCIQHDEQYSDLNCIFDTKLRNEYNNPYLGAWTYLRYRNMENGSTMVYYEKHQKIQNFKCYVGSKKFKLVLLINRSTKM